MANEYARLFRMRRVVLWQDEVGRQSGELLTGWGAKMTNAREAGYSCHHYKAPHVSSRRRAAPISRNTGSSPKLGRRSAPTLLPVNTPIS
jgi:hypothetical protein